MNYKLASFILGSGAKKNKINEVFIAQPDSNKEALAGRAFIVIETDTNKAEALKIIDFLINNFNNNYYQNEKIQLRERIETLKVEHIFESALAKTNKNFAEFIKEEKIKLGNSDINAVIGVVYEDELHYSSCGNNKALLIFNEKNKSGANHEINNHKLVDVGLAAGNKGDFVNDFNKLFSNVISGKIPPAGYFLFTNEAFPEYLSSKQIIEIITKLPPAGAAEQIKTVLSGINSYVSFLGIIIKNTLGIPQTQKVVHDESVIPAKYKSDDSSATQSVTGLKNTEDKTERMLSPSGSLSIKKYFGIISTSLASISPLKNKSLKLPKLYLKDKIFVHKKPSLISINKVGRFIAGVFISLVTVLFGFLKFFTSIENFKSLIWHIKSILRQIGVNLKELWRKIANLNRINKFLFVVFVVCVIVLAYNIDKTEENNLIMENEQIATEIIEEIKFKQNQVDAHLLYSNEEKATEVLSELKTLLASLSQNTEDQKVTYNEFFVKHSTQLAKIQHIESIENPTKLADFNNLNSTANTNSIILVDNKVIAGDPSSKSAYVYSLTNNTATQLANLSNELFAMDYPSLSGDNLIFYLNNNKIAKLNPENQSMTLTDINIAEQANIKALQTYSNRLYVLDTSKNQIMKYNASNTEYNTPSEWLNAETDLSMATDIYIDGNIYILFKNGVVEKFFGGDKEDFSIDAIDPPLANADKLIVDTDDGYLYILEKITNRIAVFDINGEFLLQYKSEAFTDIKDFDIDAVNKKIYVLNNSQLYAIDFKH